MVARLPPKRPTGERGWQPPHPPRFFGLKFLPLGQLQNAFVQLFLDDENLFRLSDVNIDEVITKIMENKFCCQFLLFFNKNDQKLSYSNCSDYIVVLAYKTVFCSYFRHPKVMIVNKYAKDMS